MNAHVNFVFTHHLIFLSLIFLNFSPFSKQFDFSDLESSVLIFLI